MNLEHFHKNSFEFMKVSIFGSFERGSIQSIFPPTAHTVCIQSHYTVMRQVSLSVQTNIALFYAEYFGYCHSVCICNEASRSDRTAQTDAVIEQNLLLFEHIGRQ